MDQEEVLVGILSIAGLPVYVNELYQGPYEVTPKADEVQVLQTINKTLQNNVTVFKVPYYEVSNLSGKTVYIAEEVQING